MRPLAALSLVLVTACAPSVNPAMQSATDALIARTRGARVVGAVKALAPPTWAVGQWAAFAMLDVQNQRPAFLKLSVVDKEDAGIWVESEMQDYFHHSVTKTLYRRMPRTVEEAADAILKIVTKTDDQAPQTLDFSSNEPGVVTMKNMMKSMLQGVYIPELSLVGSESVSVPAGSFAGCTKSTTRVAFGPVKAESTAWFHPVVPLNGVVRSEATDGSWTMELLDFGTTGAKSALR